MEGKNFISTMSLNKLKTTVRQIGKEQRYADLDILTSRLTLLVARSHQFLITQTKDQK